MPYVLNEIASQPQCWRQAVDTVAGSEWSLPRPGERVAVIGCGTSWFVAMAYASLREAAGQGWTDAFTASELPLKRGYDRVVGISRSGTTTEVAAAFSQLPAAMPKTAILGVTDTPIAAVANNVIDLSFADEKSVVQTRFATSVLALLRASLGENLVQAIADCEQAVQLEIPQRWVSSEQVSFIGKGWTIGLAQEAALKNREAAQSWAEAYPAMDYRHGPIAIAEPGRLVWAFGEIPNGLADQVAETGAELIHSELDPMADLVYAQRLAIAKALAKGLDPDQPRHLTRSVILEGATAL
ncbi:MAG: sugar isomerase [Propionibacteriaceae bacterium]|jgi:fructoselysine-6-P-deglycase FrlB-like protein|nr:sugar isomerase [Propionibacteriaceae bacterium]